MLSLGGRIWAFTITSIAPVSRVTPSGKQQFSSRINASFRQCLKRHNSALSVRQCFGLIGARVRRAQLQVEGWENNIIALGGQITQWSQLSQAKP